MDLILVFLRCEQQARTYTNDEATQQPTPISEEEKSSERALPFARFGRLHVAFSAYHQNRQTMAQKKRANYSAGLGFWLRCAQKHGC